LNEIHERYPSYLLISRTYPLRSAHKVSMTKVLIWLAEKHLGSSFTDEDEEK
jgi:hypothetical protein